MHDLAASCYRPNDQQLRSYGFGGYSSPPSDQARKVVYDCLPFHTIGFGPPLWVVQENDQGKPS